MAGSWWWYPGQGEPIRLGDLRDPFADMVITPPIDRTPTTSDMRTDLHDAMERLAQPEPLPDLEITFTPDTTRWDAATRQLLLALAVRFTAVCPGCRRDTHWLDYDLEAESCRACLDVIPRLQRTMRSAHVGWAPISPELHWKRT